MCQTNVRDVETGRKGSDIHPKIRTDLPMRKKAVYMDQALSEISKKGKVKYFFFVCRWKMYFLFKSEFGKFNYFLILICGMILNAVLLETLGISFVLPVSTCDLNLTTKEKGILSAVGFMGIIFSSHLWGYLADTKGRKRIIKPTLLIGFCLSVCSSLTDNFYVFVILRFLNGFL